MDDTEPDEKDPEPGTVTEDTDDDFKGEDIAYQGEIEDVHVSDDGTIVVVDEAGVETIYEPTVDAETGETKDTRFTDERGDSWVVDKEGNVSRGGSNIGNDAPDIENQQQFTIEEKIVIAVLEDFKTRMEGWLEVYGKGPLSDYEMMLAEGLPGCLPEDEEIVETANTYVDHLLNNKEAEIPVFTRMVSEGSDVLKHLSLDMDSEAPVTNEWEKFSEASDEICPYLKAEAEEILNATKTYFVDYEEHNIVIHDEIAAGGFITYLTPSGTPFKLPKEARPSFTGSIKSEDQQDVALNIARGVLLAFKDQTGVYGASFTCTPNGDCKFKGYKKTGTNDFKALNDPVGGSQMVLLGIEDADCYLRFVSGNYNYQSSREGELIAEISLSDQFIHPEKVWLDREGCTPDAWSYLRPISYETFTNNVYAKYNYYGYGGVLQKLTTGDYIYSNVDDEGNHRYVRWNVGLKEWVPYDPTDPNCTSCELGKIMSVWGITRLFKETGHEALDIAGMIPGVGEPFDAVNGVWYTIDGDAVNATLSFSATLPIVGWVSTGGKWAAKVTKIGKVFKSGKAVRRIELLEKLTVISDRFNSLKFSNDAVKLFQKDLQETEGLLDIFLENPNLVDSWKRLDELGTGIVPDAFRRNPKFLEALNAPKGSRKAPSTYLDADYIASHLAKFDKGSSRIVLKDSYLRRGIGKPDAGKTEFVFPSSEMDEILSLPNAEKAKKLGIPESQLAGELVRIDFKPTDKIEMPSGNEFGANDQWIPGGKTDGGVSEAIVKTEGMQLDIDYTVEDL